MTNTTIETFISRLRDRPWIDPALVDVIAHGLRTAGRVRGLINEGHVGTFDLLG
jgi:hypothetical protein